MAPEHRPPPIPPPGPPHAPRRRAAHPPDHRDASRRPSPVTARLSLLLLSALILFVCLINLAASPESLRRLPPSVEEAGRELREGFVRHRRRAGRKVRSDDGAGEDTDEGAAKAKGAAAARSAGDAEEDVGGAEGGDGGERTGEEEEPEWWSGLAECRYEGNCPRGATCVWNPRRSSEGGFCRPYLPRAVSDLRGILASSADGGAGVGGGFTANLAGTSLEKCAAPCRSDVLSDERFYIKASVTFLNVTLRAVPSTGRPSGCVVLYRRRFKAFADDYPVEEWRARRREAVVRTDPIGPPTPAGEFDPSKGGEQVWAALCYDPCRSDGDCAIEEEVPKGAEGPAFTCNREKETCQRRRRWIPPNANGYRDLVIVTAANSKYFPGLANLAASLHYWAPRNRVVVYDLGLKPDQLAHVRSWPNVRSVRWAEDGIPRSYPDHVRDAGTFAWKLLALDEALRRYNSTLWIDAGSTVTGPIDPLERTLERTGSLLMWGQDDDMTKWSMHDTYAYFNTTKDSHGGYPHYSGGYQGFLRPSRFADDVLSIAVRCALVRECIDKPARRRRGDTGGHRYDQTVLSIIAYRPDAMPRHHTEYLAGTLADLSANLSLPSERVLFTSRQKCGYYAERMGWGGGAGTRRKREKKPRKRK